MAINDYTTVEKVKAAMPDSGFSGVNTYDVLLAQLVTQASRAIDTFFKRTPGAFYVNVDTTRLYDGPQKGVNVFIDDMAALPTLVEINLVGDRTTWTTLASSDYRMYPLNALADGVPYDEVRLDILYGTQLYWPPFPASIRITGKFGFSVAVPGPIERATITQAGRWFKRGQQGFQDAGAIVDMGQLTYVNELDPDIRALLSTHYKRVTV